VVVAVSADQDISLEEKRVYAGGDARTAFVATGTGLLELSVSDDRVGEFGLAAREPTADVVADDGRVAAATDTDAVVASDDGVTGTDFGPAAAVGFADGLVACAADGDRVARLADGTWTDLAAVTDVRAVAGDLLAAADGVFRLDGGHVGLADARDVAVGRDVFAATADGLYALANGWVRRVEGGVRAVATRDGRAVAVRDDGRLLERRTGEWVETGASSVVDAAVTADALYAVTDDGTFLAAVGTPEVRNDWRERRLGVADPRRLAVV
jgi:hypothetical protein